MTSCSHSSSISMRKERLCSGKCGSDACGSGNRVWVLAASEGMAALYEKHRNGELTPVMFRKEASAPLIGDVSIFLERAATSGDFGQLLLVGSPGDISWMLLSLPETVTQKVVAEVKYPLLAAWFGKESGLAPLRQALENVLGN